MADQGASAIKMSLHQFLMAINGIAPASYDLLGCGTEVEKTIIFDYLQFVYLSSALLLANSDLFFIILF